jgi:hypothetical protein
MIALIFIALLAAAGVVFFARRKSSIGLAISILILLATIGLTISVLVTGDR